MGKGERGLVGVRGANNDVSLDTCDTSAVTTLTCCKKRAQPICMLTAVQADRNSSCRRGSSCSFTTAYTSTKLPRECWGEDILGGRAGNPNPQINQMVRFISFSYGKTHLAQGL